MLILASQSPRRAELLRNAGISFLVRPANIDETQLAGELPGEYVERLAREKALAVLGNSPVDAVVLGADTTVVIDGQSLGKPTDAEDARRMLSLLSGRAHEVITGVCLAWRRLRPEGEPQIVAESGSELTEVEFCALRPSEIASYIATGEPMDKAGAYAIQGRASRWIPRIRGCYFNVVGLPVSRVCSMLAAIRSEETKGIS